MVAQYSLDDYATIQSSLSPSILPPSIHAIIQKLILDLGVSYNSSPMTTTTTNNNNTTTQNQDSRHYRDRNDNRHSSSSSSSPGSSSSKFKKSRIEKSNRKGMDTTWEKQAEFIATKILKKEGIEKLINEIRVSLNKISAKNYETHRDTIFQNINDIVAPEQQDPSPTPITETSPPIDTEQIDKIAAAIFEIASTNKFYSVLYATLYKELTEKYPIFNNILQNFISTVYLNNINSIEYVDEKKDYDKFCLINKENDRRKAMSVFIVNLMKKELIPKCTTIDIITHLQDLVMTYVDQPDKNYIVDEITENIFLILTTCEKDLIEEPKWTNIVENIQTCSQYKVKEHQSVSSRAIFKYKDIIDVFKRI